MFDKILELGPAFLVDLWKKLASLGRRVDVADAELLSTAHFFLVKSISLCKMMNAD